VFVFVVVVAQAGGDTNGCLSHHPHQFHTQTVLHRDGQRGLFGGDYLERRRLDGRKRTRE